MLQTTPPSRVEGTRIYRPHHPATASAQPQQKIHRKSPRPKHHTTRLHYLSSKHIRSRQHAQQLPQMQRLYQRGH
ncbi:hypothetical protein PMIN01_06793 [Paraphaeosphaeria minitans]|uniref:Uncharacterized protein n=1 Tax=Paraphaeosphaeria minitans TaxID=565426 RepID=A0A9P6GHT6_9PLEO|nr:hypothetical protein PMIN01_06793 [Paraphaeosphaeria minitans]